MLPETVEEVKGGAFADCFIEHEPEGTEGYILYWNCRKIFKQEILNWRTI